uniref:Uncharacterized protein n=1 Tax=Anopheles merus TaxID=30066 RepID=A0A182VH45_ANOME
MSKGGGKCNTLAGWLAGWLGENLSLSETYHFTLPASAGPLVYVIGLQALSLSLWAVGFHVQCSAPRTRENGAQKPWEISLLSGLDLAMVGRVRRRETNRVGS